MVKSYIPFGHVKSQHQAWWSSEVEKAITERCKALLPLTEVIKSATFISLPLATPRSSIQKQRHGMARDMFDFS